jgi:hypothetical protein
MSEKNGAKKTKTVKEKAKKAKPEIGRIDDNYFDDPTVEDMGYDTVEKTDKPEEKSGRRTKPERPKRMKSADVPPSPHAQPGEEDTKLTVDELKMEVIPARFMSVHIVGQYPLLFNRPNEETIDKIAKKQQGEGRSKKDPRDPQREYVLACHLVKGSYKLDAMNTNKFGCPAIAIKKAMIRAGYEQGDEKNMKSNYGSFFVHGPYGGLVPIECPPPVLRRDVVVLKPAGTLTPCYRPEFWPWEMKFVVKYWHNLATYKELLKWLQLAGQHGGIGSRRIGNSGEQFGGFDLVSFRPLPADYQPTYHRVEVK